MKKTDSRNARIIVTILYFVLTVLVIFLSVFVVGTVIKDDLKRDRVVEKLTDAAVPLGVYQDTADRVVLRHITRQDWLYDNKGKVLEAYEDASEDQLNECDNYYDRIYLAVQEAGVEESMSQSAAWECIHTWICENTQYDNELQCLYWTDIFDHGRTVCNGYSSIVKLMCWSCGIECYKVDGMAEEDKYHSWNYLCLDGVWYWTDLTWEDEGIEQYALTEALWADHVPASMHYELPACQFSAKKQ